MVGPLVFCCVVLPQTISAARKEKGPHGAGVLHHNVGHTCNAGSGFTHAQVGSRDPRIPGRTFRSHHRKSAHHNWQNYLPLTIVGEDHGNDARKWKMITRILDASSRHFVLTDLPLKSRLDHSKTCHKVCLRPAREDVP